MSEDFYGASLAQSLERCRLQLAEATAKHATALEGLKGLWSKREANLARHEEIVAERLNGKQTRAQEDELSALGFDRQAITALINQAQVHADTLTPDEARAELTAAEAEWLRHERATRLTALVDRARKIEANLCQLLGEVAHEALQAGKAQQFREVWQPSSALETLLAHTRLPTIAGLRRAA